MILCLYLWVYFYFLCNVCVFFSFFSFFYKVASLLGLCLFWQPATWFIYVKLLHYIAIHVVANKVLSLYYSRTATKRVYTSVRKHSRKRCSKWMNWTSCSTEQHLWFIRTVRLDVRLVSHLCTDSTRHAALRTAWTAARTVRRRGLSARHSNMPGERRRVSADGNWPATASPTLQPTDVSLFCTSSIRLVRQRPTPRGDVIPLERLTQYPSRQIRRLAVGQTTGPDIDTVHVSPTTASVSGSTPVDNYTYDVKRRAMCLF